ncbi:FecR family protein [Zhouia amylolytica]|uniref:FecR family protein n=1 Tax=Zhouia amylolytica TaxID=376730 RepID=UPI0011144743|nr:FecR family protein [Zhouia amylolytica]
MKTNLKPYTDYKLDDFLADESYIDWIKGKTEDTKWNDILIRNPHLREVSDKASIIIRNLDFHHAETSNQRIQDLRTRINKQINRDSFAVEDDKKVRPLPISELISKRNRRRNIYMIAASFIGLIIISSGIIFKSDLSELFFDNNNLITRVAQKGEKLTTFLHDGTKVVINGGSSITFKEEFDDDVRHVVLEGEAFFDVVKNPEKPFVVNANGVITTALGTSFNINQNQNRVEVSLTTGKVSVVKNENGNHYRDTLVPGEQILADFNENHVFLKQKFNKNEVVGWMNGNLIFNNDNGLVVLEKLENWYGINIVSELEEEALQGWSYSGKFQNESLQNVLESISFVKEFEFKIKGDLITIYRQK